MRWLIRIADRTHPLVLPGVWVLITLALSAYFLSGSAGQSCCWDNELQLWGSALTFILVPGYLVAAFPYLYRGHRDTVRQLRSMVPDVGAIDTALADLSARAALLAVAVGLLFGLFQSTRDSRN